MCRAHRHGSIAQAPLHFYVYETEPEVLARHILLISVLLDEEYPVRDRVEMFLEVHGNALLSERTAAYLGKRSSKRAALHRRTVRSPHLNPNISTKRRERSTWRTPS